MRNTRNFSVVLAAVVGLTACIQEAEVTATAGDLSAETPMPSAFTQFPDIPTPVGAKILIDKTLVLGGGDTWTGQMMMRTGHGPFVMFDFFKQKLPEFGWTEVTSVRAPTSVLTYIRENRIASIQIQGRTIQGSEITVTVSPKDARTISAGVPATQQAAPPPPPPSRSR